MAQKVKCRVETCMKLSYRTTGYCRPHARAFVLYGDPLVKKQQQWHGLSLHDRFMKYVKKTEECWQWVGMQDKHGYGRLNVQNFPMLAHRLSWELAYGSIPESKHVLHKCDHAYCVNPDHLFLGDQVANIADMYAKGRSHTRRGRHHTLLSAEDVKAIRQSTASGKDLALHYHVSETTISEVRHHKIWRHID